MSQVKTLLLELHCEEIPARFLKPLSQEFESAFSAFCDKNELMASCNHLVERFYSPRKLAWRFSNLLVAQPDQTSVQVGPPQRMCVDENGTPTQTGLKFAEKWEVPFDAIRFEQPSGKKEPCAVVTLTKAGRSTKELLSETLPKLIESLHVPKAMRWGNSNFEFVRPIRNILCLFGEDVVPFDVDGVQASNTTWGHRLYHTKHPEQIRINDGNAYAPALEKAGVIVGFEERRAKLEAQLAELASEVGGKPTQEPELLDTLALIVEFPRILRGAFPPEFMALPKEVLVTSLKEHQKAFCVENAEGNLLPYFLTAANRPDDPEGFVASGNEWVLKARLYDARFFFAEDQKTRLSDRLEKLKSLTFQRDLGSYLEKTERMVKIVDGIASRLGLDAEQARTAARLAKADLTTLMVGEFPELQGIMGGEYLRHEGMPEAVWKAVKEHYQPLSAEAPIPSTPMGGLIALSDKLDTVVGCFAIGLIPSGSKDPLALRRAGQGIVRILWEQAWDLDLQELFTHALKEAIGSRATQPEVDTLQSLSSFFKDRVAYQLELGGYPASVRRSVLGVGGWSNLVDLRARCEALSVFAEDPRFSSLAQSAKRIGNILKDESIAAKFDATLLQQEEEKVLSTRLSSLSSNLDHPSRLTALAELAQPLEDFFSAVMVKCEDPALRGARLRLLSGLSEEFKRIADFSLWQ
jgi:glycyl-tRNA synthetase beta chain